MGALLSEELVGTSGLEPPTSRLSGARSNHLSYAPMYGGDEEVRTPDPLRARQVLSQLSYTPKFGDKLSPQNRTTLSLVNKSLLTRVRKAYLIFSYSLERR